jgi:hypothetical protein
MNVSNVKLQERLRGGLALGACDYSGRAGSGQAGVRPEGAFGSGQGLLEGQGWDKNQIAKHQSQCLVSAAAVAHEFHWVFGLAGARRIGVGIEKKGHIGARDNGSDQANV